MRRQQGFTYLGLIILVGIIGMVGAAGLKVGSLLQRAAAEEELLEIGAEFSRALKSYADATPQGHPPFPATLQELLRDPRVPGVRRHLRKIHVDPVTGKAEWGLITMGENAGVLGVYSLSTAKPLKVANFDARFTGFENKQKISDWKFMMPGQSMLPPAGPQSGISQRGALPSLFGAPRAGQPGQPGQPMGVQAQGQAPAQPFGQAGTQPFGQAATPPAPPALAEAPPEVAPAAPEPEATEEAAAASADNKEKDEEDKDNDKDNDKDKEDAADSGGVRGGRAR